MKIAPLTILNHYDLTDTVGAFRKAIERLVNRVEREGHPGVLSYRFYLNDAALNARAVIDYESPEAWIGHHDIAMDWPEMKAMHSAARLREVVFLGPLTPPIQAWIDGANFGAKIRDGNFFAAGFRRDGS